MAGGNCVGIMELSTHNEVVNSYLRVLQYSDQNILCFTNLWVRRQIYDISPSSRLEFHLREEGEDLNNYLQRIKPLFADCRFLIITSLETDPIKYEHIFSCPTIYLIHSAHAHFSPWSFLAPPRGVLPFADWLLRLFYYVIKGRSRELNQRLKHFDYWAVPSMSVLEYVQKDFGPLSKLVGVLDFDISSECVLPKYSEAITIVIPGGISSKSRDYSLIVKAFALASREFNSPVYLHLLGPVNSPYARKIVKQLSAVENENFHLIYYNAFINQVDFDKAIRNADFMILPMNQWMKFYGFKERNGFSCVSGNINDMVRFNIPTIIPAYYPLSDSFRNMVAQYLNKKHLTELIISWVNDRLFEKAFSNKTNTDTIHPKEVYERWDATLFSKID